MTPLGLLNFMVLQWFGVRLQAEIDTDLSIEVVTSEFPLDERGRWWSRYAPRDGHVSWTLLRWVWPLTGWWSPYRRMDRESAVLYAIALWSGLGFVATQVIG